jgi:hypothetical protein
VIKGFVDRSKSWLDKKEQYTNCATEVIKSINPVNPITASIIQMTAFTTGRVVGHVLFGIFTAGIGNIIMETAFNVVFIINGTLATVKAGIALAKAISDIVSNVTDRVKKGVRALGSSIPQFIIAIMKFFGGSK